MLPDPPPQSFLARIAAVNAALGSPCIEVLADSALAAAAAVDAAVAAGKGAELGMLAGLPLVVKVASVPAFARCLASRCPPPPRARPLTAGQHRLRW